MDLVVDANILFSALLKDSLSAELLFNENLKLYTPQFLIKELFKYEKLILTKTHRPREKYIEILHCLKDVITTVPKETFSDFLKKAKTISPDREDAMYFALALKLKCGIWSNDKKLKEQNQVKVYSTDEIRRMLK